MVGSLVPLLSHTISTDTQTQAEKKKMEEEKAKRREKKKKRKKRKRQGAEKITGIERWVYDPITGKKVKKKATEITVTQYQLTDSNKGGDLDFASYAYSRYITFICTCYVLCYRFGWNQ